MELPFTLAPIKFSTDKTRYYAKAYHYGTIEYKTIIRKIAKKTGKSLHEIKQILDQFGEELVDGLQQGAKVELGTFFTLYHSFKSDVVDHPAEFHPDHFKSKEIKIRPSKQLKRQFQDIPVYQVDI
ncbi:HU family DNA-binding protein [candidate division KSB1 bacterium]|nr:HU family DNA-binding protein [candidate division KSB1 bacterium]